jgi:mRNA interferase MazF
VGHEQGGRRPAIVLSPKTYNRTSKLALFCPITSRAKNYPFEFELPPGLTLKGVVLTDQIKSFDWAARNISFVESAPQDMVQRMLRRIERMLPGICEKANKP